MSSSMLPFEVGQSYAAADFPELASLVGQEIQSGRRRFRVCKAAAAIGATSAAALYAQGKALKWSTQSATSPASNTVAGGSATTSRICAVVPEDGPLAIASGDIFLGQIEGFNSAGKLGDQSGDDTTAGHYIICSADADLGKIRTGGSDGEAITEGVAFGRALTTQATDDGAIAFEILGRLT